MAKKSLKEKSYFMELAGWEHAAGMHIDPEQKRREGCPFVTRDTLVLFGRVRNPGKRGLADAHLHLCVAERPTDEWNRETDVLGEAWVLHEEASLMAVVPVPADLYTRILIALTCNAYRQFTVTTLGLKQDKGLVTAYSLDGDLTAEEDL